MLDGARARARARDRPPRREAGERPARATARASPSRILDFGLARSRTAETLTAAGDVPGRSPTSRRSGCAASPARPAGDVWSVGVLLYEALAGRHPFWRPSLAETADAIDAGRRRRSARMRPDLPEQLLARGRPRPRPRPAKRPRRRSSRGCCGGRAASATRGARSSRARPSQRRLLPALARGVYAAELRRCFRSTRRTRAAARRRGGRADVRRAARSASRSPSPSPSSRSATSRSGSRCSTRRSRRPLRWLGVRARARAPCAAALARRRVRCASPPRSPSSRAVRAGPDRARHPGQPRIRSR